MRAATLAVVIVLMLGTPFVPGAQQAPAKGEHWAVVIGAQHQRRQYAAADAQAMYHMLVGPMGLKKANVILLTDPSERKPTLHNIKWALGTFLGRSAKRDDSVYFFFAGQGSTEASVKYLMLHDTDPNDLHSTALPIDGLPTIFSRIEAEHIVAFLDANYSGAVGDSSSAPKRRGPDPGNEGQLLERLAQSRRQAFIVSSRPSEISLELPDLGHGIFTHYLVEGLKGAADTNRDGIVSLQEAFEYLEQQVARKSRSVGGNQHAMMIGGLGALPLVRIKP